MVKCVDTYLLILSIWSTISPFDMSVKKKKLIIHDLILMSTFFTCSTYMQNCKNIVSTLWLPLSCLCLFMSWIWNFVPLFLFFFVLCPVSDLFLHSEPVCCFWSVKCTCFHMITKILHLPFTPLLLVFPFSIYNHSTLHSKWMNEWSERM